MKIKPNFELTLCDFNETLCNEWELAFIDYPEVMIKYGIFEHINFDCIVSPANSFGLMDGGIDEAISMFFGPQMQIDVQARILSEFGGEQPIGTSIIVAGTKFNEPQRIRYVAHTPTMIIPTMIAGTTNIYMAMKAMLLAVESFNKIEQRINSVVCSGLGTGAGRVPPKEAAREMVKAYTNFIHRPDHLVWPFAVNRYKNIKNI